MKSISQIVFGCLMVFFTLQATAQADSYTIGVEELDYYPLYAYDGDFKGYARDLLDAFAADSGHTFTYKAYPVARLFDVYLTTDSLDFKYPDNPYWNEDAKKGKNVVYSEPTVEYIDGVSVKPENANITVDELKTLGIIRGFTPWDYLDLIKKGTVAVDEVNDYSALLRKTMADRTKGSYSNVVVVQYQLQKIGKPGALVFAEGLPHTKSAYHLSTIKHPEIIKEFNEWMASHSDVVNGLKEKYKTNP